MDLLILCSCILSFIEVVEDDDMHFYVVALSVLLSLSACAAAPSLPSPFALAEIEIAKREARFNRENATTLFRTLHGKNDTLMRALNHHPLAHWLRDKIYQRSDIVAMAKRDPKRAADMVEAAIAQLPRRKQRAVRNLPTRMVGDPESVTLASNITLPLELSDKIHAEAVRLFLVEKLWAPPSASVQDLAFRAVKSKDVGLIDYVMWLQADPNSVDILGQPLLYYAIRHGDIDMVDKLLFYGANKTARDAWKQPLLYHALQQQDDDITKHLITSADAQWRDSRGEGLILHAVLNDGDVKFDLLLQHGAKLEWVSHDRGSLVHHAVVYGLNKILRRLLAIGGDPNGLNLMQDSHLWTAVMRGRLETAEILLQHGASPHWQHAADDRSLLELSAYRSVEMVSLLVSYGADTNALRSLSLLRALLLSGRHQMAIMLLKHGANPNGLVRGLPLLYDVLLNKNTDAASLLVRFGASLKKKVNGIRMIDQFRQDDFVQWVASGGAPNEWFPDMVD